MNRQDFVNIARRHVPQDWWEPAWWLAPAITLLLLPSGTVVLKALGWVGWLGAPRATQGLMVLAVVSGPIVGSLVLWSAKEAELKPSILRRAQWLARLALFVPFLTLLIMFWVARVT